MRRSQQYFLRQFLLIGLPIIIIGITIFNFATPSDEDSVKRLIAKQTNLGTHPTAIHKLDEDTITIQPFLSAEQAEVGDWLLIYKDSQKAVLFRPSSQKIISLMDTTRPDGLDLTPGTEISIFFPESAKNSAEQTKQNLLAIWPELENKITLHSTNLNLPDNFITSPDINTNPTKYQDLLTITEKLPLPILYDQPPSELASVKTTDIMIYLHK